MRDGSNRVSLSDLWWSNPRKYHEHHMLCQVRIITIIIITIVITITTIITIIITITTILCTIKYQKHHMLCQVRIVSSNKGGVPKKKCPF